LETDDNIGNKVVAMMTNLVTSGNSFKLLFGLIDIAKRKMSIIRQDRQKLVLDLYYNQGKTIRDIAKEARMSLRDIGSILNKADERREQNNNNNDIENKKRQQEQQEQQLSLSTQAYKLFSEGKSPIQVAVALNQKESEITRFYKEYIKLNQMHDLNIVYEEVKGDIVPFLKLYRSTRSAGMNEVHVLNLLRIANDNNNLSAVEHRYERLKQEVNALEFRKLNLNNNLQDLKNQISTLRKTLVFVI
jgi:transposase